MIKPNNCLFLSLPYILFTNLINFIKSRIWMRFNVRCEHVKLNCCQKLNMLSFTFGICTKKMIKMLNKLVVLNTILNYWTKFSHGIWQHFFIWLEWAKYYNESILKLIFISCELQMLFKWAINNFNKLNLNCFLDEHSFFHIFKNHMQFCFTCIFVIYWLYPQSKNYVTLG
jgi:hypothetical protein